MKTSCRQLLIGLAATFGVCDLNAQGTFQDLNFESPLGPLVPSGSPGSVPFTNAFPGWVGYVGTNIATDARIYGINLDNATLALINSNLISVPLIEGNYTAVLQAGINPQSTSSLIPVALAQTGLVPTGTESLQFEGYTAGTPFSVSLGGVDIPIFNLGSFGNHTLYGGNIPQLAGTVAELRFTAYPDNYPVSTTFALDSILFSNQPVPEPNALALIGVGALILGRRLQRRVSTRNR